MIDYGMLTSARNSSRPTTSLLKEQSKNVLKVS